MKLSIGYFADGPWSYQAFKKLIVDSEISIEFVCVRFDTQDETLKKYCKKYDIDYLKEANVNSINFVQKISKYNCDLLVSMSFNQIFRREMINLTKYKMINCHAGKLPFYRGRNVLNWALINDEKEFGITVHYVDEGVDTGDIILQDQHLITDFDDYSTLLTRSYSGCAAILYKAICLFKNGRVKGRPQTDIHPVGFYCSQRKIGDEYLNWNMSSREVFSFVRALCRPGPMARSFIDGSEVRINRVDMIGDAKAYHCIPGAVLSIDDAGFLVKTKDTFVKVVEYDTDINIKVGDRFNV